LNSILAVFGYSTDHASLAACPIHHRIINYPSDTFPLKTCLNHKENLVSKKLSGHSFHQHHGTCQRYQKAKRITTPIITETIRDDQQQDLCDRSFSSSSAGGGAGHYCTHSSNDSTRPLISHPQTTDNNEHFKHSAPPSTGSSSHSSSGIGSSMESPYNHWKYLTPLSVTTTANERKAFLSDNQILSPTSKDQSLMETEQLTAN
jgi:hypothetical protein